MATSIEKPLVTLTTSKGKELLFKRMSANEQMGHLFEVNIEAVTESKSVKPEDLLGTPAHVSVELSAGKYRQFHGLVCAMGIEGASGKMFSYRMILRPWLWLLTRRSDTRIFQNMTMEEILKKVFLPFSPDYKFEIVGTLPKYEYCVQYRETDFNFVSRLLEHEGAYYYFKHTASQHTLVIVNAPSAHQPGPHQEDFEFRETVDSLLNFEPITEWRVSKEIQSGQVVLRDFDFVKPKTSLEATSTATRLDASTKLEIYDYPGAYVDKAVGLRYSKLRIEELQAQFSRVDGFGALRGMACGYRFNLSKHPSPDQNVPYLVVSTNIECAYGGYESGGGKTFFHCHFTAIDCTETFRPPRITPKPTVSGLHTAIVVGPAGEEIHVDPHGRVKVQFHWDRIGKLDDKSSCWVRVSSPWAGKGWGMISLPRIGQEVIVDFLEGDPDRPMITGRVYNGEQATPYALPANMTVSTNLSRSSKSGTKQNFNELRFEDKQGSEYVWLQAERDFHQYVKNDATLRVVGNQERIVEKDQTEEIKGDAKVKIGKDFTAEIVGAHSLKIAKDAIIDATMAISQKSGAATDMKIGTNLTVDAGGNVHIKAGANLVLEASVMMTLKAGGATVVLNSAGVSIVGTMVNVNSGGGGSGASSANAKAAANVTAPKKKDDPLA